MGAIVEYTASDGQKVKLSPAIVAKYVVTGNSEADERDVFRFMVQCQARGLNPLAGDAYMTVFNGYNGKQASVIVSKDYYLRTAAEQPDYDGMEAGVVVAHKDGGIEYRTGALVGESTERLIGGWARVYSKERSHPSEAVVSLKEYDQHRSLWKTKPATMIRKVAVVQALRDAYPGKFGGVYDQAEMPEPMSQPTRPPAFEQTPEYQQIYEQAEPAESVPPAAYEAEATYETTYESEDF